ncbi:hypothetical protein QL285_002196 [Trifolium repens]|nr:hypothetical protein QL285_002196 [Trifolium repens]
MAPLLNSRTASMIGKLLDIFRLAFREIPSDVRGTMCFLCSFVFILFYAYCSIFVVKFILPPILPHYQHSMPIVKLNSFTVTSLNTQSVNLTGTFDIKFDFNTSKCDDHTISFHDLEVKVWWFGNDDITLAAMRLSPFSQTTDSVTEVEAILKVADGFNNDSEVVNRITYELAGGSVNFGVSLFGSVRFRDDSYETLRFVCNPVVIVFSPGSKSGTWNNFGFPCLKLRRKFAIV